MERLRAEENPYTLMLLLLRTYGMRTGELLQVRTRDINHQTRSLMIRGTKGSNDREFPLTSPLYKRIKKLTDTCLDDDERVFKYCRQFLCQLWHKYRPAPKGLHCLRHTVGVELYRKTRDIKLVQNVLGHKSIVNTNIYLEFCYNMETFRRVFGARKRLEPEHA